MILFRLTRFGLRTILSVELCLPGCMWLIVTTMSTPLSEEAVLYAEPCRSQAGADDLASRLPPRAPGDQRIRIGLAHGQTFDIAGYQTNFPIGSDAAQKQGLNYLAIGDTHAFRELPPKATPTVYPGAPEVTKFGELDAGFVAVVFFPQAWQATDRSTTASWPLALAG